MNDYYSQFPGPSCSQAMVELCNPDYSKRLNEFIENCLKEEWNKYGSLGSQTGWNVSVKPKIVQHVQHKL